MFARLCLAIAFSPRSEALLAEAARLAKIFNSHLTVLHVGEEKAESVLAISASLTNKAFGQSQFNIICESGSPARVILSVCKREKIDLLVAGALQKENIIQYYLGTIGRTILRKARCSVLMLTNPSTEGIRLTNIVTLAEDSPYVEDAIAASCTLAQSAKTKWIHIVRELKMFGLTLSALEQSSEEEYDKQRQQLVQDEIEKVEAILNRVPHSNVKVNIKVMSGKSGFELAKFAEKKKADLLVVGAPNRRIYFFDRFFRHDLEYLFADLPCNLLIVHGQKPLKK
jgi:nucleotide-binding universal stress UspA family protein